MDASSSSCSVKTVSGKGKTGTCVFPFKYNSKTYTSCADVSSSKYFGHGWCAFDKTYKSGRWGICAPSCPGHPSSSCKSQSVGGKGKTGTCVFPFKYNSKTYSSCADVPNKSYFGHGWCAFDKTYSSGRWGLCTPTCPGYAKQQQGYFKAFNGECGG